MYGKLKDQRKRGARSAPTNSLIGKERRKRIISKCCCCHTRHVARHKAQQRRWIIHTHVEDGCEYMGLLLAVRGLGVNK